MRNPNTTKPIATDSRTIYDGKNEYLKLRGKQANVLGRKGAADEINYDNGVTMNRTRAAMCVRTCLQPRDDNATPFKRRSS